MSHANRWFDPNVGLSSLILNCLSRIAAKHGLRLPHARAGPVRVRIFHLLRVSRVMRVHTHLGSWFIREICIIRAK